MIDTDDGGSSIKLPPILTPQNINLETEILL